MPNGKFIIFSIDKYLYESFSKSNLKCNRLDSYTDNNIFASIRK